MKAVPPGTAFHAGPAFRTGLRLSRTTNADGIRFLSS